MNLIVSRLAALMLVVSLISWPSASGVGAQGAPTAEDAIRAAVGNAQGVDPAALIVKITAETDAWAYASAVVPAGSEDDAPSVSYALAYNDGRGWIAEIRYTDAFNNLLRQAPADFPNANVRAAIEGIQLAGDGSADLSFPFPVGESWQFNGPHPNGPGRVWSSLDFYRFASGGIAYDAPITAMRGGVVSLPCANMVVIDHGDGWSTTYYHVININVSEGQTVSRGQRVGGTSAEFRCGGAADGPHMHIWTTYNGVEMAIDGTDIGGWTVSRGAQPYDGCLTRDSVVLCRSNFDAVTNDGSSGSAGSVSISPTRTTVNNWITFRVDNLPANSSGQITWRRLSGSTINIDTFTTNSAGVATGRFRVPATPGGPNQLITFKVGNTTRTATFEVAPRIKVTTNPGERGGQVDVSLRGYAKKESVRIRWYRPNVGWVQLGTVTTSNTGSANLMVTVPSWAPDGANKVRGDGTEFRQQTNVVMISGGVQLALADDVAATPEPSLDATPEPIAPEETVEVIENETPEPPATEEPVETPVEIDRSALPAEAPHFAQIEPAWTIDPVTAEVVATYDTGAPHRVSTVGWLVLDPECAPLLRLEYSADGVTWTPVELVNPADPGVWQAHWPDLDAQFMRWISSASDPATVTGCLAEIAIWATPVPPEAVEQDVTGTPVPASTEADGQ